MIQSTPKVQVKIPSGLRFTFWTMANHNIFEYGIYICILLNTIVLTIVWYDQSPLTSLVTNVLNYVFAGIFAIEALIKLIAFGRRYFLDPWNVFDFIIVIGTFLAIGVSQIFDL